MTEKDVPDEVLGEWMTVFPAGGCPEIRTTEGENLIATVQAADALRTSMLIARTPALRDAVKASLTVFRLIAERGTGPSAEAAGDMIPCLESVMAGIED